MVSHRLRMWCDSGTANPEVVELGAGAEREGHVVDGLLAEHPRRVERPVRALGSSRTGPKPRSV